MVWPDATCSKWSSNRATPYYCPFASRGESFPCQQHLSLFTWKTGFAPPCPPSSTSVPSVLVSWFERPSKAIEVCCQPSVLLSEMLSAEILFLIIIEGTTCLIFDHQN